MSNHKCIHDGCESTYTPFVAGHYMVGPRAVRVWACTEHYMQIDNPLQELPTPASILAGIEADKEAIARAERIDRQRVIDLDERSVHAFSQAGAGKAVPFDRVRSWRWGA